MYRTATLWLAASLALANLAALAEIPPAATVVREEALRSQQDPSGRPLPLVAHWHRQTLPLSRQLRLIEDGYPVLPWLDYDRSTPTSLLDRKALGTLRDWRLPVTLITGGQWEADFYLAGQFQARPLQQTGLADDAAGRPVKKLSPFSPVEPWRELGRTWTDNLSARQLQAIYPDPPLVLFVSNNEAQKLRWTEAETSKAYLDEYGTDRPGAFKRKVFGDGWIARYSALFEGMRAGLVEDSWRRNSRFVGYGAFGPDHWGRWGGWRDHSLVTEQRISPEWYSWDGAAKSAYDNPWESPKAVFNLWSMQSELMNIVFMKDEAYRVRPEFWFELIFWDGSAPGAPNDTYLTYAQQGIEYTPAVYGGWVQYCLWLLVPRVAREWRGHDDDRRRWWPQFEAVLQSVRRVHEDAVLRRFWRNGELVPNLERPHPFNQFLPQRWRDPRAYPRWFHLEASTDPPMPAGGFTPGDYATRYPVWTLARSIGKRPRREWLLYAHAPAGERFDVTVRIPGYRQVLLPRISVGGSFYHLMEMNGAVVEVGLSATGGASCAGPDCPRTG